MATTLSRPSSRRKAVHRVVTFGISEQVLQETGSAEIREGQFCKRCGARLEYDFYHYSQIGVYHCPECGFARPAIDFDACHVSLADGLSFDVKESGTGAAGAAGASGSGTAAALRHLHANYRGFYNIYNILAAYAAMRTLSLPTDRFDQMLDEYSPENGRNELFTIGKSRVLLNLAKNPAGFNQNITALFEDPEKKDLIIVINDNAQDGTDISWLWDVDFDRLDDPSVASITVSGIRCLDMRLRLKYVGMQADLIADVKEAIRARLSDGCGNLYVLVNYTALYSTHNILKAMEKEAGGA